MIEPQADEMITNLLEGIHLDVADLRDMANDPSISPVVRNNLSDLFAINAELRRIINVLSPYNAAVE